MGLASLGCLGAVGMRNSREGGPVAPAAWGAALRPGLVIPDTRQTGAKNLPGSSSPANRIGIGGRASLTASGTVCRSPSNAPFPPYANGVPVLQHKVAVVRPLPWDHVPRNDQTPTGLRHQARGGRQPFQGWLRGDRVPGLARASRPWAERQNPVGIRETANAPPAASDQSAAA